MAASKQDLLVAQLFFNAAFPVMQVVLEDDPKMREKFKNVTAKVQISVDNGGELVACYLDFNSGKIDVVQGPAEKPDITLHFKTVEKMNAMFRGGSNLPGIKGGFRHPGLLLKTLSLLMALKLMMPNARPDEEGKKKLKIKMSLYMVTKAISYCNKNNALGIHRWCVSQPDRIYQFTVEPYPETDVACYLRVKAGNSKSGHGVYTRRSPFVHFHFLSVDGALKVLLKDVEFVEGVETGCVEIIGSPEYAMQLNDFMAVIQSLLT